MVTTASSASNDARLGYTVVELLVVLAIVAMLTSIAAPRYLNHVQSAKEAVLRTNLATMRDAIDKFAADNGRYPESLAELTSRRYLRDTPVDPLTERSDSWIVTAPKDGMQGGVQDIRSSAPGLALDGTAYVAW